MLKQFNVFFQILFCVFIVGFIPTYTFNHYNAWLGIILYPITIIISLNIIKKLLKK